MNTVTEIRKWLREAAPVCAECAGRGENMAWGGDCSICGGSGKMPPSIGVTELRSGQMIELHRSDGKSVTVARPTFDAIHGEAAWTLVPIQDGVE